jgi:hypothetical protein
VLLPAAGNDKAWKNSDATCVFISCTGEPFSELGTADPDGYLIPVSSFGSPDHPHISLALPLITQSI